LNLKFTTRKEYEQDLQTYLNNIDPTNPGMAPIRALLVAADNELKSGKVGGISFSARAKVSADGTVVDGSGNVLSDDKSKEAAYNTQKVFSGDVYANVRDSLDDNFNNMDKLQDNIGEGLDAARANNSTATADVKFSQGIGGNPWLAGNVYVAFLISFIELQRLMMKNKMVQGQIELATMNMITELAKSSADAIMAIAKTNQMIHIATAVMSAVSIAITIVSMVGAVKAASRTKAAEPAQPGKPPPPPPPPGRFAGLSAEQFTMIGTMSTQLEKMSTASVQAATDLSIAQKEGLKEMIQSYRTIQERQMNKSSEIFKDNSDAIVKLIQDLDRVRQDLAQAIAAALRKG
jgi:hypothetical protein